MSRAELSATNSDWTAFIGPTARDDLEVALRALGRRRAAPLRAVVDRADAAFLAKTYNNPLCDATQAWWHRRWQ